MLLSFQTARVPVLINLKAHKNLNEITTLLIKEMFNNKKILKKCPLLVDRRFTPLYQPWHT